MTLEPAYRYRAIPIRVIDGDTYVMRVDLGFRCSVEVEARVHRLACPELREPGGQEARRAAEILLSSGPIVVESYKDQRSFARWVMDVYVNGESVAEKLVASGNGTLL